MGLLTMTRAQKTLVEEDRTQAPASLIDLDDLDLHLAVVVTKAGDGPQITDPLSDTTHRDTRSPPAHTGPPTSKGTPRTESEIVVRIDGMDEESDDLDSLDSLDSLSSVPTEEPSQQDE